jgi:hypothetical protein
MRRRTKAYSLETLAEIVAAYEADYRERCNSELGFYASQPTFAEAVRLAGLAEGPGGKRMGHQRRIPRAVLQRSAGRLGARIKDLERARRFDDVHDVVADAIARIEGIGELTIYDTALRIAAYRRLAPTRVYLHAGTREGAYALGVSKERAWVSPEELPAPFRRLRAGEIEDCLCIYKADLRRLNGGPAVKHPRARRKVC